ncbi:HCN1 [Symbiodinium natans]|uniref:HCN1 protein n=1 Tax=Symbiodinium natans TaxID=878477 RepID=A0A812KK16_9DINO|nr:HCN1 [Symbiodinium natans]
MLVMRFQNVAVNYLSSWFLLDFSVITVDWVLTALSLGDDDDGASGVARLSKALRLLHFLRLARVVRMIKTNAILQHLEENTLSQVTMTQYSLLLGAEAAEGLLQ